jgi:hypothetical protein
VTYLNRVNKMKSIADLNKMPKKVKTSSSYYAKRKPRVKMIASWRLSLRAECCCVRGFRSESVPFKVDVDCPKGENEMQWKERKERKSKSTGSARSLGRVYMFTLFSIPGSGTLCAFVSSSNNYYAY